MQLFKCTDQFQYIPLETLHEGQLSKVLRAFRADPRSSWRQECVLKIIKSKNSVEDCVLEYQSLLKVNSKNCVRVNSWEWIEDCPTLIMEFIDGLSLHLSLIHI